MALADHDADLSKAYLADIQSTRAMQVAALGQEDIFSKRFLYYVGAGWSLFAMVNFCAVTFVEIPARGQRIADTILDVLISTVMGAYSVIFTAARRGAR